MIYRINRDWYKLMDQILHPETLPDKKIILRSELLDSLLSVTPIFAETPYFFSEEFSLIDCCIGPLLWRLPQMGIDIPNTAKDIIKYMNKIFSRPSFQASLTDVEKATR